MVKGFEPRGEPKDRSRTPVFANTTNRSRTAFAKRYVYIYIYREREIHRYRERYTYIYIYICTLINTYMCIYIYI